MPGINHILIIALIGLNKAANVFGAVFWDFFASWPGWLSNTIISFPAGIILLVVFKYTSNQTAISKIRNYTTANMLALWLFKDELSVTITSIGKLFSGSIRLLFFSVPPFLVMCIPVILLMAQLGSVYQFRPLQIKEETLLTLSLNNNEPILNQDIRIEKNSAFDIITGPVKIPALSEISWKIRADQTGRHQIVFHVNGEKIEKKIVVGDGYQQVSPVRPGRDLLQIALYPLEKPFTNDGIVESIRLDYPERDGWAAGANWWIVYFFVVSLVAALAFKPVFDVKI